MEEREKKYRIYEGIGPFFLDGPTPVRVAPLTKRADSGITADSILTISGATREVKSSLYLQMIQSEPFHPLSRLRENLLYQPGGFDLKLVKHEDGNIQQFQLILYAGLDNPARSYVRKLSAELREKLQGVGNDGEQRVQVEQEIASLRNFFSEMAPKGFVSDIGIGLMGEDNDPLFSISEKGSRISRHYEEDATPKDTQGKWIGLQGARYRSDFCSNPSFIEFVVGWDVPAASLKQWTHAAGGRWGFSYEFIAGLAFDPSGFNAIYDRIDSHIRTSSFSEDYVRGILHPYLGLTTTKRE